MVGWQVGWEGPKWGFSVQMDQNTLISCPILLKINMLNAKLILAAVRPPSRRWHGGLVETQTPMGVIIYISPKSHLFNVRF